MAQTHRIDLLQNNSSCAAPRFPPTYPVFLSGKVTRDIFLADVEELNAIIKKATAITRFKPVGFLICAIAFPTAFWAIFTQNIGAAIGIAFVFFFIGFFTILGLSYAHARQLQKAMGTDVPAAINRMAPTTYERHGVGLSMETYQTQSMYFYREGVGGRSQQQTITHYTLVVTDGERVMDGQVIGQAPPVQVVVVGALAPPAPSGFCTQCGAAVGSGNFCGSCGAAK